MASNNVELEELTTIRKLLVLALLRSGMTQAELGATLGIHRTQVGRMFPKGALAEIGGKKEKKEKKGVEGN
jgi:DNA-binding transcriptional regulator LsrR (DeoR family)